MANDFAFEHDGDYQQTNTYREASRDVRRQLNRYKKENNISDEHMFLLLLKQDLANTPEDQRSSSDISSKLLLLLAVLLFFNAMSSLMGSAEGAFNVATWAIAMVCLASVALIYYTGILNPYKRSVRKVNKYLKGMPEVVDFETWCESHPLKRK